MPEPIWIGNVNELATAIGLAIGVGDGGTVDVSSLATSANQSIAHDDATAITAALGETLAVSMAEAPAGAATETTLAAIAEAVAGSLAISATSLPLPSGAATSAAQSLILSALEGTLTVEADALPLPAGAATQTTLAAILAKLPALVGGASPVTSQGWSSVNLSASGTTTQVTGAGVLHGVTVNSKGTIASNVTIYDNTAASGKILAVIDTLNLSGQFVYDLAYTIGLTIVVTGTVAPNITVSYR